MITIKLSSVNAHPREVFKVLEDRRAEIEWALKKEKIVLPKYQKSTTPKLTVGVWNMVRGFINELKP